MRNTGLTMQFQEYRVLLKKGVHTAICTDKAGFFLIHVDRP